MASLSLGSAESSCLETDVGRAEWEEGRMPVLPSLAAVKGLSENFK